MGLATIMAVFGYVAFSTLKVLPVFDDEAIAVRYAHVAAHPRHISDLFGAFNYSVPPLYIWLSAIAEHAVADPLLAARIVSVLAGVLAIPAVYILAWQLYQDVVVGLVAAVLLAFCPYEFMFDRMALLDPLVQLIGLLVAIQSLRLFRAEKIRNRDAAVLGVLLALGQLSKGISTFFWLLPILAWLIYDRHRSVERLLRSVLISAPIAASLYSVILASGNVRNLFRPFFTAIKYSVATPYPGYYSSHAHESLLSLAVINFKQWVDWQLHYVGYALLAGLIISMGIALWRGSRADHFVLLWLILPLAAMLFVKIYTSRYVLFTVPIELLLIGRGVASISNVLQVPGRRAGASPRRRLGGSRILISSLLGAILLAGAIYTLAFDAGHDARLARDPSTGYFEAVDRWQYIEGWPSGYGLDKVESYIRQHAAHRQAIVLAGLTHQPINALVYGLAGNAHIHVLPVDLARKTRLPSGLGGTHPIAYAVLNLGKDDVTRFRASHPGWTPLLTAPKPASQSAIILLGRG